MAIEDFKHAELTERLIQIYFEVYTELGYGLLESIYEKAFVLCFLIGTFRFSNSVHSM